MNLPRYSLDNRKVIFFFLAILLVGGIVAFTQLGKKEDSPFVIKSAAIVTRYPGATPEEVEQLITEPIEREIQSMRRVYKITSESWYGMSKIMIELQPSTPAGEMPQMWDELRRKIMNVQPALPDGASNISVSDDFGDVFGIYYGLSADEGFTYEEANDKMFERNYFGMMMVETGDADAFITGLYTRYSNTIKVAKEVIGIQPGFNHFGTMHILNSKKGTYFLADTLINRHPDTETLIDIAKLADKTVRFFNHTPVISMLSYSNFGADTSGSPVKVHGAVNYMQKEYPELAIDGEMQVNFAMNRELRDAKYPFTRLKGKDVNTLIFPNLSSANAGYKLLQAMDPDTEFIGPIQMGLNKPIHFTDFESSVRDIVNITAVAVIDAIVDKKKKESK